MSNNKPNSVKSKENGGELFSILEVSQIVLFLIKVSFE